MPTIPPPTSFYLNQQKDKNVFLCTFLERLASDKLMAEVVTLQNQFWFNLQCHYYLCEKQLKLIKSMKQVVHKIKDIPFLISFGTHLVK